MAPTLARRERHQLCDLALELGEGAATLCGEWTAGELVAHLWVREHRPEAALGSFVSPLGFLTDAAMSRAARQPFPRLVQNVRSPRLTPFALRPVDVLANTMELLVHHEDLRRAQAGWEPRALDADDLDETWTALGRMGRLLVRRTDAPVTIRRTDTGAERVLRGGGEPVVVAGPVVEVALTLFGRSAVRDVEVTGPPAAVAQWESGDRSF
jgi:uncharacterized protein (TIGR03085 family)